MSDADPFVGLLVRHRLPQAAAPAVARLAERLRALSERDSVEYAAMLDAGSGAEVGPILRGGPTHVSIGEHLHALELGRSYVQLHTHLTSPTWSLWLEDGVLFAAHPPIRAMVVVGVDGTRYVLSRGSDSAAIPPELMDRAWRQEAVRLLPSFRPRVATGRLSKGEAEATLRDQIWRSVATRFGLRYDRVEPRT